METLSNTLSALSLAFAMFIAPALICGGIFALPSFLFVLVQKFSHRHFPRFSRVVIGFTSICSFAVALFFTTWYLIEMIYALGIPSSQDWAEKQKYYSDVIDEATYRSLVPVYFQQPCAKEPEIVCQLGSMYTIDAYEMPLVSGLVSAITTILIGLSAQNRLNLKFQPRQREVTV
jgi:hypothetical protein